MNKSHRTLAIALMLCFPILVAGGGLVSYFTPPTYHPSIFLERRVRTMDGSGLPETTLSFEELNGIFLQLAPTSRGVSFEPVRNTDLVALRVSGSDPRKTSEEVKMLAEKLQQKLKEQRGVELRTLSTGDEAPLRSRPSVVGNMALGASAGIIPAILGLLLLVRGSRQHPENLSPARQAI